LFKTVHKLFIVIYFVVNEDKSVKMIIPHLTDWHQKYPLLGG